VATAVFVHLAVAERDRGAGLLKKPLLLLGLAVDSELESVPALKEGVRVV